MKIITSRHSSYIRCRSCNTSTKYTKGIEYKNFTLTERCHTCYEKQEDSFRKIINTIEELGIYPTTRERRKLEYYGKLFKRSVND